MRPVYSVLGDLVLIAALELDGRHVVEVDRRHDQVDSGVRSNCARTSKRPNAALIEVERAARAVVGQEVRVVLVGAGQSKRPFW